MREYYETDQDARQAVLFDLGYTSVLEGRLISRAEYPTLPVPFRHGYEIASRDLTLRSIDRTLKGE